MGKNLYGEYGHLSIFTLLKQLNDAFDVQYFQASFLHIYQQQKLHTDTSLMWRTWSIHILKSCPSRKHCDGHWPLKDMTAQNVFQS